MAFEAALVVMAAGMGSRFGGLKQVEPVGPKGEAILDFSVYDAKRAGFTKVVFVIKHQIEEEFKKPFESGQKGIGLRSIAYRLNDFFKNRSSVHLEAQTKGTVAKIIIPADS